MAWAHLAGSDRCHSEPPVTAESAAECPEHTGEIDSPTSDERAPASPACCEDGGCSCALPHSAPFAASMANAAPAAPEPRPETTLSMAPSPVIDDSLRPPIY